MVRISFFLSDPNASLETPVYMSITYNGQRAKLKTKQKIKPKAFNKNKVRKNWTEYSGVQVELDRIETISKNEIKQLVKKFGAIPAPKELKKILEENFFGASSHHKQLSFWDFYESFIKKLHSKKSPKTGKPIAKSTINSYEQTKKTLQKFEEDTGVVLSFLTLSNLTYDSLLNYMETTLNFVPNTVGKHIKNLKSVINSARDEYAIPISNTYRDKYWQVQKQIRKAEEIVFLNETELNNLAELDFSDKPKLDKARDIFLVGAWTGLRISDIVRLNESHLSEDSSYFTIHTKKTDKTITVPAHPILKELLKKYQGAIPRMAEPLVNSNIKIVCKKLETMNKSITQRYIQGNTEEEKICKRYEKVTTHTARRSFASNMFKKELPVQYIMAMTGHKKEEDFYRYIGVTHQDILKIVIEKFKSWYSNKIYE
ncbi:tyrosine-type recombinase/integrase [Aequorivita echinoideorum]|uniref:Tyrosine-type recombinase/integrase n=1 Tax=Aequorivita echinoideorum TaxID=1549647 RepID=A0ABS5S0W3_9FLAO|nr:tyrosine-type recombinase/integrase [Aequorivita echinoideorum]MBT0606834.1 tyrosine-type recombinase/integrase [Aequorivita echinoideorum]